MKTGTHTQVPVPMATWLQPMATGYMATPHGYRFILEES